MPKIEMTSEVLRRALGMQFSDDDWAELVSDSERIQPQELDGGRRHFLMGKALMRGLQSMSGDEYPAHSDMSDMLSILMTDYRDAVWTVASVQALYEGEA